MYQRSTESRQGFVYNVSEVTAGFLLQCIRGHGVGHWQGFVTMYQRSLRSRQGVLQCIRGHGRVLLQCIRVTEVTAGLCYNVSEVTEVTAGFCYIGRIDFHL